MFDLDHAIAAWRRTFEHRRSFSPADVDELEAHIRDHVEAQVEAGASPAYAFEKALERFGTQDDVEAEYRKVFWAKRRHEGRVRHTVFQDGAMLKNFVKIAFRNIGKAKGHAFINIFGMGVALACCLLILLFIHDEWSHDRFHEHAGRIYRLTTAVFEADEPPDGYLAMSSRLAADHLLTDYPQVQDVVRLQPWDPQVVHENRYHDQDDFLFADTSFFDVFTFRLLEGDTHQVLKEPFSLVLTESMARRYFSNDRVLGRQLILNDSLTFTVTGVAADPPTKSHFTFDALASYATKDVLSPPDPFDWVNLRGNYTYVLLTEDADPAALDAQIADIPIEHFGERLKQFGIASKLALQPMERIYLYSESRYEIGTVGSIATLRTVALIGLFILLIASINFMNLSTARSMERAREVGIRKLVGSRRGSLVAQFMSESIVTTLFALLLSIGLATLALPRFNVLAGKSLTLGDALTPMTVVAALLFAVLVGLLAGSYPAFVLSGFRPAVVLKGAFKRSRHGIRLRQTLVVIQFTLSIALVIGTLVVHEQLSFMQNERLGFDDERVLVLDMPEDQLRRRPDAIKNAFGALSDVQTVSFSNHVPGGRIGSGVVYAGEQSTDTPIGIEVVAVDENFVEAMGIEMAAGRDFASDRPSDVTDAALINETAAARLGYASPQDAIGEVVIEASDMHTLTVVGVVRDYHQVSLREQISPMLLRVKPIWFNYVSLRLGPGALTGSVERIHETWSRLFPGHAFDFFFLDEAFDRQYAREERLMSLFGIFAGLTILIAALGLFGLASTLVTQRSKEIGVRKVLGASTGSIVGLLIRGVAGLVVLAIMIGSPLGYAAMDRWLADFAYRIDISWMTVVLAGAVAFSIALITVSYHALRAAYKNPVTALRYE